MSSYARVSDDMKRNLEQQLRNIELQEKENARIVQMESMPGAAVNLAS
jgi:hypothetical protein